MTTGDDPTPVDPTVLESAMDTVSEEREPGDRPAEEPLTDDERALLDRLVDVRVGVAEDDRPVGEQVVDVPLALGVPQVGAAGAHDHLPVHRPSARGCALRDDSFGSPEVGLCVERLS